MDYSLFRGLSLLLCFKSCLSAVPSICQTDVHPRTKACYWAVDKSEIWFEALADCESHGGTLAIMDGPDVEQFIEDSVPGMASTREFHIGMSDGLVNRQFRWVNTRAVTWTHWYPSQPDDWHNSRCMVQWPKSGYNSQWHDWPCRTGKRSSYLCQSNNDGLCLGEEDCLPIASWVSVTDTEVTAAAAVATFVNVSTVEDCKLKAAARVDFRVEAVQYNSASQLCQLYEDEVSSLAVETPTSPNVSVYGRDPYQPRAPDEICLWDLNVDTTDPSQGHDMCQVAGGALLSIRSAAEYDMVMAMTVPSTSLWLGMGDEEVEGVWRYLDGTFLNWANWAANHPNIKQTKKCAKLRTNGLFYEYDCTAANSRVYCEKYKEDLALYVPIPEHGIIEVDKAQYTVSYTCEPPYALESEDSVILIEFDCSAQNLSQFVPSDLPGCIDPRTNVDRLVDRDPGVCSVSENARLTYVAIPLSRLGLFVPDETILYSLEVTGGKDMTCGKARGIYVMVLEGDITDSSSQCNKLFKTCTLTNYTATADKAYCVFGCPNWPSANTDYVYVRFHSQYSEPCEVKLLP